MVTLEELYLLLETPALLHLPTNLRILKTRGTDVCIENLSSTHNLRTLDTDTDFYYWHSYGYEVPTLSQLTNLKCLRIQGYSEELEIGKLITLTSLKADYIFPHKLIGLTNLTKLHTLDTNISTVVSNLTSLRELTTSNISVEYTPFLKKIEVLDFRWNEISADAFGMLPLLREIKLHKAVILGELPLLENLEVFTSYLSYFNHLTIPSILAIGRFQKCLI
jgi:hypothetical protein